MCQGTLDNYIEKTNNNIPEAGAGNQFFFKFVLDLL